MLRANVTLEIPTVRSLIEKHYGLKVKHLEKVRAAYRVETKAGVFAFKNARKMKDIHFVDDVIRHLKRQGFTRIPSLFPAQDGKLLIHYLSESYYMEEWLTQVREVKRKHSDWLVPAGEALAQFHQSLSLFPHSSCPRKRNGLGKWPQWLQGKWRLIRWAQASAGTREIRELVDFTRQRIEMARAFWNRSEPQKRLQNRKCVTLCHGSLHHENIMVGRKGKVWLIDYERLVLDERVRDLAQLMQYHFPYHQWREEEMKRFLNAYSSKAPLDTTEYFALCSRLAAPSRLVRRVAKLVHEGPYNISTIHRLQKRMAIEKKKESFLNRMLNR